MTDIADSDGDYVLRVRIDRWMVDLYEELQQFPKGIVRAREALHLMRLGVEARKNPRLVDSTHIPPTEKAAGAATKNKTSESKTRAQSGAPLAEKPQLTAAEAEQKLLDEVREFGQTWNLASMLVPPPQ